MPSPLFRNFFKLGDANVIQLFRCGFIKMKLTPKLLPDMMGRAGIFLTFLFLKKMRSTSLHLADATQQMFWAEKSMYDTVTVWCYCRAPE